MDRFKSKDLSFSFWRFSSLSKYAHSFFVSFMDSGIFIRLLSIMSFLAGRDSYRRLEIDGNHQISLGFF